MEKFVNILRDLPSELFPMLLEQSVWDNDPFVVYNWVKSTNMEDILSNSISLAYIKLFVQRINIYLSNPAIINLSEEDTCFETLFTKRIPIYTSWVRILSIPNYSTKVITYNYSQHSDEAFEFFSTLPANVHINLSRIDAFLKNERLDHSNHLLSRVTKAQLASTSLYVVIEYISYLPNLDSLTLFYQNEDRLLTSELKTLFEKRKSIEVTFVFSLLPSDNKSLIEQIFHLHSRYPKNVQIEYNLTVQKFKPSDDISHVQKLLKTIPATSSAIHYQCSSFSDFLAETNASIDESKLPNLYLYLPESGNLFDNPSFTNLKKLSLDLTNLKSSDLNHLPESINELHVIAIEVENTGEWVIQQNLEYVTLESEDIWTNITHTRTYCSIFSLEQSRLRFLKIRSPLSLLSAPIFELGDLPVTLTTLILDLEEYEDMEESEYGFKIGVAEIKPEISQIVFATCGWDPQYPPRDLFVVKGIDY